jgi:hypothetical protein
MKKKKHPKTAILDGDIIAYKAACLTDIEGSDGLLKRLRYAVKKWIPSGIKDIIVAFSCNRKDNYRRDFWVKYKAKRDGAAAPDSLQECKDCIYDNWECVDVPRLEADDLLGIHTSSGDMVGVTIDKDLLTIPGFHWNPDKDKEIRHRTEEEADRSFYFQWMIGDSTDGVPGLWRVGPKKANRFLDDCHPKEWDDMILEMYNTPKYRNNTDLEPKDLALAMARSVRILRSGEYNFDTQEISLWCPKVGPNDDKE